MTIAILGAGLAGLAAARRLQARGVASVLFDKGRAPGGRMATRRAAGFAFDHGAQYLKARDAGFADALASAGAAPWPASGGVVGVPSMSALPRRLAEGLDVRAGRHVVALERDGQGWRVSHADARALRDGAADPPITDGPFDAVLCTLPAPQAAPLLRGPAPGFAARAAAIRFRPCWTLMAAFPSPLPLPDTLDAPGGAIGWACRDSAKPGRDAGTECWVVQASAAWSDAQLEQPADAARALLLDEVARRAGPLPSPLHAEAHRWRFAVADTPLGEPCLWDGALALGLAGDWCLGDRADAAWSSGTAAAEAMLASLAHA